MLGTCIRNGRNLLDRRPHFRSSPISTDNVTFRQTESCSVVFAIMNSQGSSALAKKRRQGTFQKPTEYCEHRLLSPTTKMTLGEVQSSLGFPGVSSDATFQRTATIGKNEVLFPGVVKPIESGAFQKHLESIKATSRDEIIGLLQRHGGALVLRGFGPSSAQDFSDLAHGLRLGPHSHQEVGRPPRRTVLAKGVSTANEGPPDSPIWVHNEYGWSTIYPSYVLFFALQAPKFGTSSVLEGADRRW